MRKYYLDGLIFVAPSHKKYKKYDVYDGDKFLCSFGAIKADGTPYPQYHDKISHYRKYNTDDPERRKLYKERHAKEKGEYGSPSYFAMKYLW